MTDFDQESFEYGADPLEREVLDSALSDGPPADAREKLLAALNLAPSTRSTERPSPWRVPGVSHAGFAAIVLALGAGAAAVVGLSTGSGRGEGAPSVAAVASIAPVETAATNATVETAAPAATNESQDAPASREEKHEEAAPSTEPAPQVAPLRPLAPTAPAETVGTGAPRAAQAARSVNSAPSSRPADAPAESTLGRELARVTAARSALAAGDAARSLQNLDAYDAEFPTGAFSVEVEVLRIEALARSGHAEEARRRGDRFLAQHPEGLFARRVTATLRNVAPIAPVAHDPLTPTR